jgi:hypothetical protein
MYVRFEAAVVTGTQSPDEIDRCSDLQHFTCNGAGDGQINSWTSCEWSFPACSIPSRYSADCLLGLLFDPDDRGSTLLRNVGKRLPDYVISERTVGLLFIFEKLQILKV